MSLIIFDNLTDKDKAQSVEKLISESSPRQSFFLMIGLSVLMATFGLLLDSAAIIIGSMLIAPLLYPLLSFGLGVVMYDFKLMGRSVYTIAKSTVIGVILAVFVALVFSFRGQIVTPEILGQTQFLLSYVFVAIIAGLAGSFVFVKPQHNEHLPGVAISVALIPPIALIGIGIAWLDWSIVSTSLILYLVNVVGIVGASIVVFSRMKLAGHKKVAIKAVKKEDKIMEKEIKSAGSVQVKDDNN